MSFPVTWTEVENRLELSGGTLTGSLSTKNVSITGNLSVTGSITGNASSATKLATARTIGISGGVTGTATGFNGTANISIPVTSIDSSYTQSVDGKLKTLHDVLLYTNDAGSVTGTLKITLPVSWTNTMMTIELYIWNWVDNTSSKYIISGYNYIDDPTWTKTTCIVEGYNLNVRLAHDGSKCCILIGSTTQTWRYPKVVISKVICGYTGWNNITKNGWTAEFITDETSITNIVTPGRNTNFLVNRATRADYLTTSRTISLTGDATASGSFNGSANLALSTTLADSGVTAGSYGPTGNATMSFGGTVNVPQITVDAKGRSTTIVNRAIKLPAAPTTVTGNAGTATKLQTARTIAISGGATGTSTSFDGSANITIPVTALDVSKATAGTLSTARGGTGRTDGKAVALATARTIDGISFDGSANRIRYGSCSTAAATVEKVVSLTGFTLATGAEVTVRFTVTNTAASPTLNVNGTGAKPIVYRNAAISAGYLAANRIYKFVYDGAQYELIGDINTDTNNRVTMTVTTTNAEYPILTAYTANRTATATEGARFDADVKINPSDNSIRASKINSNLSTGTHVQGAAGNSILNSSVTAGGYVSFLRYPSTNGVFTLSGYQTGLEIDYLTKANVDAGTNTVTKKISLLNEAGNTTFPGTVTATAFSGPASKLGTDTVGSTSKPIYLNAGTATALSATVGAANKPIYSNAGTLTACSSTVGSATQPTYLKGGTVTACTSYASATVGNSTKWNGAAKTVSTAAPSGGANGDIWFQY